MSWPKYTTVSVHSKSHELRVVPTLITSCDFTFILHTPTGTTGYFGLALFKPYYLPGTQVAGAATALLAQIL